MPAGTAVAGIGPRDAFLPVDILNAAMLAGFIINHRITAEVLGATGLLLPGLVLGIAIGHALKVSDRTFKTITYCMLLVVGITLVIS